MESEFNTENFRVLTEAIVKTIAYFDIFDYPLTLSEILRYNPIKCELTDILNIFDQGVKGIETKYGFYFLSGRAETIRIKNRRYNFSQMKFKRAKIVAGIFKIFPWIKMIAIGNLMGSHNLSENGDIDFFIITEKNRIWVSRFFGILVVKLLGLRPKPGNSRDKICLSFFISEDNLSLERLMLKPNNTVRHPFAEANQGSVDGYDIYFVYWLAGLTPIFDRGDRYGKFISANRWLWRFLPNWSEINYIYCDRTDQSLKYTDEVFNLLFAGLEKWFKKIQLKLLPFKLADEMNRNTKVVINDQVLKLHANDRREEYRRRWEEKIGELLMTNFQ